MQLEAVHSFLTESTLYHFVAKVVKVGGIAFALTLGSTHTVSNFVTDFDNCHGKISNGTWWQFERWDPISQLKSLQSPGPSSQCSWNEQENLCTRIFVKRLQQIYGIWVSICTRIYCTNKYGILPICDENLLKLIKLLCWAAVEKMVLETTLFLNKSTQPHSWT